MESRTNELLATVDKALAAWDDFENPRQTQWAALDAMTSAFAIGTIPGDLRALEGVVRRVGDYSRDVDNGFVRYVASHLGTLFAELRQAREQAERYLAGESDEPAASVPHDDLDDEPLCPETWQELFALTPPISFQQLIAMKRCTLNDVYRQARILKSIPHLPPEEQAAAIEREKKERADKMANDAAEADRLGREAELAAGVV